MLSIMLIHSLLNVMTVISVAVFFIEPERTKCLLAERESVFGNFGIGKES